MAEKDFENVPRKMSTKDEQHVTTLWERWIRSFPFLLDYTRPVETRDWGWRYMHFVNETETLVLSFDCRQLIADPAGDILCHFVYRMPPQSPPLRRGTGSMCNLDFIVHTLLPLLEPFRRRIVAAAFND